jgi:hypothetical protein
MMNTKILVATAALAAAIASSTLAQGAPPIDRFGSPSQFDNRDPVGEPRATKRSYDVYHNGQYVGSNPDPNIRLQLQRELDEW